MGGNPSNTAQGLYSKAKSPKPRMGEAKSPQVPQLTVPWCRTVPNTVVGGSWYLWQSPASLTFFCCP